jgi:hypothetical protein
MLIGVTRRHSAGARKCDATLRIGNMFWIPKEELLLAEHGRGRKSPPRPRTIRMNPEIPESPNHGKDDYEARAKPTLGSSETERFGSGSTRRGDRSARGSCFPMRRNYGSGFFRRRRTVGSGADLGGISCARKSLRVHVYFLQLETIPTPVNIPVIRFSFPCRFDSARRNSIFHNINSIRQFITNASG